MDKTPVSLSQPVVREASQIEPLSLDLSLAEGVDKELTCAVCLARYKHPKVLPCLHTYCQNCLESLSGSTSKLTCPQCKEVHEVPSGGVSSFKTYFTINNLIELLHIHEVSSCNGESGKKIQCESGLDEHAAVARCLSCSEYLCESCYGIHRRLKATRDHNMITLEKIKKSDKKLGVQSVQRKQYCEEHDDEVLKLFCKTCNKVICRDCALVKHREHDYSFIREVRPETRNRLQLLLKKVEEKESEFQGHKKHVEGLQKSNEDALNSCLKDVNEMCDKLIEVIESRRAFLIAKLHSKHEAEEEQNKGEMNSIDLSLVRLSDSIRFTHKLLDDGNDVELMTVGMQAKEALEGLSTMEWNRDAVRPSLLRLKFAPAVEDMKRFGKVLNTIQSSDILIENIPHNACVGDKLEFSVKLSDEIATRQYDAAALLSVTVTYNMRKIPVAIQNNGLNDWNISCTPQDDGEHTVNIKFGQFASESCKLVVRAAFPSPGEGSAKKCSTKSKVLDISSTECENPPTLYKKGGKSVSKTRPRLASSATISSSSVVCSDSVLIKRKIMDAPVSPSTYTTSSSNCKESVEVDREGAPGSNRIPSDHYSSSRKKTSDSVDAVIGYCKVPVQKKPANW